MTDTCRSGARRKGRSGGWGLSRGCWNFWLMLFAITSLRDVKICWVGGCGSAKTESGINWDAGLRVGWGRIGVIGVTGVVTGVAGEGLLSSGGGKVGIFRMTEGGDSGLSGSLSGSDSWPVSEVRPNLLTLFRRVDLGMP